MILYSVIIPVFNEEKVIGQFLDKVKHSLKSLREKSEIIVVNDGSTDSTKKIIDKKKGIVLLNHKKNKGYGAAIKSGIKRARGQWIFIIDADNTYNPDYFVDLAKLKDQADMIVAARRGKKVHVPLYRKPAKFILGLLANFLTATKISDLNSGMRLFRKKDVLNFFYLLPNTFSFTTSITIAYLTNALSVRYIPINYEKRKGKSKIRPVEDFLNFLYLMLRTAVYFNPLKVFLSIAFFLFLLAVFVAIYSAFYLQGIADTTVAILFMSAVQLFIFGLLAELIIRRWH